MFQLFPSDRYVCLVVSALPFHSLLPSFRFTSPLSFVTSFLSFVTPSLCYCRLAFYSLLSSFRCNSPLSYVTSFLSFQLFPFIRSGLIFVTIFLSFHLSPFICYSLPFVSTLPFHSFWPFIRYCPSCVTVSLSFHLWLLRVTVFLLFHVWPFIHYFLPFVATLPFHLLLPSFSFNSSRSFVAAFYSLQSFFRFTSDLSFVMALYALPSLFRFTSGFLCVTVFRLFHVWPFIRYNLPFVSPLRFHVLLPSFRFNSSRSFVVAFYSLQSFFRFTSHLSFVMALYALPSLFRFTSGLSCVTFFLSLQVSPFIRYFLPFVSSGYLQPLERLQVAANGCIWLQVAARPLALAAPKIPLQGKLDKNAICGNTDFLSSFEEWSNRDWHLQSNAKQHTAATCGHSSGCKGLRF